MITKHTYSFKKVKNYFLGDHETQSQYLKKNPLSIVKEIVFQFFGYCL